MIAFHGEQKIKDIYIARVQAHRAADQLIKGDYWTNGKGCAIGCTVHSNNHAVYEVKLGIPMILARLEDGIFEALPNELAMEWPEKFLSVIRPGADLSLVWPRFAVWMLADPQDGVIQHAKTDRTKDVIQDVADAYGQIVSGKASNINWKALRAYAHDAYECDAYAEFDSDAYADVAYSYAAYACAVDYATDAIAARNAGAAQEHSRIKQSEKLLELLANESLRPTSTGSRRTQGRRAFSLGRGELSQKERGRRPRQFPFIKRDRGPAPPGFPPQNQERSRAERKST